ncbi:hypothetical protein AZE42_07429 [Rhizopogon vesiculosus]|uniref:Uncharacterized protein n=1 Tax=Rhizopogon vesiculosus TaxID=180088 RepID=A0A1J8PID4_9AGAM|nr:hypothetical protein AZE42_07429 [Rhizopogon vesiculosus]
MLSFGQLP